MNRLEELRSDVRGYFNGSISGLEIEKRKDFIWQDRCSIICVKILKWVSYFTLIIPALMGLIKCVVGKPSQRSKIDLRKDVEIVDFDYGDPQREASLTTSATEVPNSKITKSLTTAQVRDSTDQQGVVVSANKVVDSTAPHGGVKTSAQNFAQAFDRVKRHDGIGADVYIGYLYTNERDVDKTMNFLKQERVYGDTFIGVACTMTLNAFSIRPDSVDHLIALDITKGTEHFWREIQAIVSESKTKDEALKVFLTKFKDYGAERKRSLSEKSFLTTDSQFEKVKKMFLDGKFVFLRCDLTDEESLSQIGQALKSRGRSVDGVYQSNIGDCSFAILKKRLGATGLADKIREYLVRDSLADETDEKSYISIFADGGRNSSTNQQTAIVTVNSSEN